MSGNMKPNHQSSFLDPFFQVGDKLACSIHRFRMSSSHPWWIGHRKTDSLARKVTMSCEHHHPFYCSSCFLYYHVLLTAGRNFMAHANESTPISANESTKWSNLPLIVTTELMQTAADVTFTWLTGGTCMLGAPQQTEPNAVQQELHFHCHHWCCLRLGSLVHSRLLQPTRLSVGQKHRERHPRQPARTPPANEETMLRIWLYLTSAPNLSNRTML